ncbi:MAG TPA: ribbon-helix-helix domain-containing protein [Candidatus Saccharimonadales bacterium]|jgi:metal-responsive CopG/Arc/MetJ family transcriptional regulator|nr:ribbon-helix-helix domain-containing protein [Candidatus Saccharimonadales bacterium]
MSKLSTNTRTINISLPKKLVNELDKAAKNEFATRSDFIRDSILRKLRTAYEQWETVTDFTLIQKGGVNIDELLKRL